MGERPGGGAIVVPGAKPGGEGVAADPEPPAAGGLGGDGFGGVVGWWGGEGVAAVGPEATAGFVDAGTAVAGACGAASLRGGGEGSTGTAATGGRALGFPRALPSDTRPVEVSAPEAGAPREGVGAGAPAAPGAVPVVVPGLPPAPPPLSLLADLALTGGAGRAPTVVDAALLFDMRVLPSGVRVVLEDDGPLADAVPPRFEPVPGSLERSDGQCGA